jgi:two-component system, response regulator YesN
MKMDVVALKLWIQNNAHAVRTIGDIADAFGIKPNTLRKDFRRKEGKPLSAFLRETRVDAMKEMLKDSGKCCFEIADCFQYAQDASAERMFKRATGLTMGQFRERHGNSSTKPRANTKEK